MTHSSARLLAAGIAACLVAGCGGGAPAPQPPSAQDTVFDPMVERLDEVRERADQLPAERKADLDRAIESGEP